MKMVYERPMMMAELYATNAYCNACGTSFKNGKLTTSAEQAKSHNNGTLGSWDPGNSGFKPEDLSHTFDGTKPYQYSEGLCGGYGQTQHSDKSQAIWKCTCEDCEKNGEVWFLEWSHYYTMHLNGGQDTFFLYKDMDGDGEFDITPNASTFPSYTPGQTDYNVAIVVYDEDVSIVPLS